MTICDDPVALEAALQLYIAAGAQSDGTDMYKQAAAIVPAGWFASADLANAARLQAFAASMAYQS